MTPGGLENVSHALLTTALRQKELELPPFQSGKNWRMRLGAEIVCVGEEYREDVRDVQILGSTYFSTLSIFLILPF
jgi:hypothetical protein